MILNLKKIDIYTKKNFNMKHIEIFEDYDFYSGTVGDDYSRIGDEMPENPRRESRAGEYMFNMLPKDLRNELPRSVKEMLINSDPSDWHELNFIMPGIEKLMQKSGLLWKRFPRMEKISSLRSFTDFKEWLKKGYLLALEQAYFGSY